MNRTNAIEWGGMEDEFEGIVERVRKSKYENNGVGRYGR